TNSIKQSQYRYDTEAPISNEFAAPTKQCMQLPFSSFTHQLEGNLLSVKVLDQTMTCPTTVATSFSKQLLVTAIGVNNIVQLDTYPAYGGLLGFVIPKGTHDIVIEPRLASYPSSAILLLLGLFSTLFIAYHGLAPRQGQRRTKGNE
ncbi:MAG: hypothetical protein QMB60_04550, partial [Pseudomonadales bacterium]